MSQVVEMREDTGRRRVYTVNEKPSKTVAAHKSQSDIREILRRYGATGVADQLATARLTFRDVSSFEDFADVMRQSKDVEAEFMRMPSKVREVFDHDWAKWLDAAYDTDKFEALRPKLEALGVVEPRPEVVETVTEPLQD